MTLDSVLAELLAEPLEVLQDRSSNQFDLIASPFSNRIVIFGAGHFGKLILAGFRNAGIVPLAFCDNDPKLWGTRKEGIEVLSVGQAAEQFKDSAAFVVGVYNPSKPRCQLQNLGCKRVISAAVMFWKFWPHMSGDEGLELPHRILACTAEMHAADNVLSDQQSRREFAAQIRWRCLMDYDCLPEPDSPAEIYFPLSLFSLLPDEQFVDCGAFDGDSIRQFLNKSGERFAKIYAWEADPENCRALMEYRAALDPAIASKFEVLPYAVGARDEMVRFSAAAFAGSRISSSPDAQSTQCRSIDSILLENAAPSFIKMDIEGAEPDALRGAFQTMAQYKPIMAVCAYHRAQHLWQIPILLKAANPDYQIYLRRYAEETWETVYYAVPPERLRSSNLAAANASAGLPPKAG